MSGYLPQEIQLTSQELSPNMSKYIAKGTKFNACSLHQLEEYGKQFPNSKVSVRFNPGKGTGHCLKTNVGGSHSSFGIWEQIPEVKACCKKYGLTVGTVHSHIGSGTDPRVWEEVAQRTLDIVRQFPEATTVNLGGGFHMDRMGGEAGDANMALIGKVICQLLANFEREENRKLHLEIEPGTYFMACSGVLLARVNDVVGTGQNGYNFVKLNTGMDALTRPCLYGSKHPIHFISSDPSRDEERMVLDGQLVVAGHNCETGDLFTQSPLGVPEPIAGPSTVEIGDITVIEGAGAYCSSMCTKNYNSYPELEEVLIRTADKVVTIRHRQSLAQMMQNEVTSLDL